MQSIRNNFVLTAAVKKDPEVFLRPKEMVYIPMKYLSYEANHSCSQETPGSGEVNAGLRSANAASLNRSLSTKIHRINFVTVGTSSNMMYMIGKSAGGQMSQLTTI